MPIIRTDCYEVVTTTLRTLKEALEVDLYCQRPTPILILFKVYQEESYDTPVELPVAITCFSIFGEIGAYTTWRVYTLGPQLNFWVDWEVG